jgi:hypothetical protein
MATTTLEYLYRDASNYKEWHEETFAGAITPEQEARFRAHLIDGQYFYPDAVDLYEPREEMAGSYDDDPETHEFHQFTVEPNGFEGEYAETISDFVDRFCATPWPEPDPQYLTRTEAVHTAYWRPRKPEQTTREYHADQVADVLADFMRRLVAEEDDNGDPFTWLETVITTARHRFETEPFA